jgi:hypothetical protein
VPRHHLHLGTAVRGEDAIEVAGVLADGLGVAEQGKALHVIL